MTGTAIQKTDSKVSSELNLKFFSHATLECKDIKKTRQFFEEFLGFEVVQLADVSFWARMGGDTIIVVVENPVQLKGKMAFLNHNGLDVLTEAEVDAAYAIVLRDAEKWGLTKISKPLVQHGTYGFYFWDFNNHAWEILCNPPGGYAWGFEMGDQKGAGHTSTDFKRPESTLSKEC